MLMRGSMFILFSKQKSLRLEENVRENTECLFRKTLTLIWRSTEDKKKVVQHDSRVNSIHFHTTFPILAFEKLRLANKEELFL